MRYLLRAILAVLLTVGGTVALVGALLYAGTCTLDEELLYEEFPQYGGREVEPRPNVGTGSCWARYETPARKAQVLAYFRGRFAEHGWEQEYDADFPTNGQLVMSRGRQAYELRWYPRIPDRRFPSPGGTEVVVHVYER